jgi:tRNA-dihydrouridine synthase B
MDHTGEVEPKSIQIAGAEPAAMADAARYNVDHGAQIIDINMGCPARKVCNKSAGSALLEDERLVSRILDAVVGAVSVPVTLKIRTGARPDRRNGVSIAKIAEAAGIQALAVHGRTRSCKYHEQAEYDTIRAIKRSVSIPVIANGDIDDPVKAKKVLEYTGADGVMIGRAAQGRPWLFRQIDHYLHTGERLADPSVSQQRDLLMDHLRRIHEFYGEATGVRVARKHIGWYTKRLPGQRQFRSVINRIECSQDQLRQTRHYFDTLIEQQRLAA